jgi:uncharacterized protein YkwD
MTEFSWMGASLVGLTTILGCVSAQDRPMERRGKPDLDRARKQMIAATNQFRKQEKLRELEVNAELAKAAQAFAEFMAKTDKYGHEADGKKPAERASDAGYDYCIVSENIAYQLNSAGFTTAELASGFMESWNESPPHRKNLLDPDIFDIGVGLARSDKSGKYYAVQNFGRPRSKEIKVQITNRTGDTVKYKLGDESFSLEPRSIVTHRMCRPADLKVQQADGKTDEKEKAVRLDDDACYVLRKDDAGKYKVEKE